MRITNSTLLRNYDRNLKRLSTEKYASENKIYSGRQYTRASQSPLKASKALTVRKQLWHTEQYQDNLKVADKFYTEAETSLLQVSEQLASVRETIIYACNSTKEKATDINILAEQLETKAKEMCSIFNTNSAERAIFGGESNAAEPFTIEYDDDGKATKILYHGVPVNAYSNENDFPYSNDVYIDVGIGMVISDNQEVDPQSMLKISFNGAGVSGCGFEGSGKKLSTLRPDSLRSGENDNTVRITAGGKTVTVKFKGNKTNDIQTAITNAFNNAGVTDPDKIPTINEKGELTMGDGSGAYVSETPSINLDQLKDGQIYTVDKYFQDEEAEPSYQMAGKEITPKLLLEAIRTLPEEKRTAILLYYFEGMTDVEIGKMFNTSRSTIQYRRTSSFELLKKYLEEHADEWNEW